MRFKRYAKGKRGESNTIQKNDTIIWWKCQLCGKIFGISEACRDIPSKCPNPKCRNISEKKWEKIKE